MDAEGRAGDGETFDLPCQVIYTVHLGVDPVVGECVC